MRKELIVIIFLVVAIFLLLSLVQFYKVNIEQADARKFVTEDLKGRYPNADIEIIGIEDKTNNDSEKYFEIKAKVTKNSASPCPERTHIYYNYPEQNFISQPPDHITKDCKVCKEDKCVIGFSEEAIIASHTLPGTEDVDSYIKTYKGSVPTAFETGKGWVVKWDSDLSAYFYEVTLSKDGKIVGKEKLKKEG
ncbi:hypothetical protein HYT84_01135 [Candidatus Micrarchaeota archaeon]|nr:hypothetical protein [Candidatus Micrarchaeota archaeon]